MGAKRTWTASEAARRVSGANQIRSATVGFRGRQFPSTTVRPENATGDTAGMDVERKSDGSILPAKPSNKSAADATAERVEGRDPAKRNVGQPDLSRTQSRTNGKSHGLDGVREVARKDSKLKFTALLHHVDRFALHTAFLQLKKTAAVGVDGVTWHEYEQNVEANIANLHGRIHRGAYWVPRTGRTPHVEAGY